MNASTARVEEQSPVNDSSLVAGDFVKQAYYPWLLSPVVLIFMSGCVCANFIILMFVFLSKTYRNPANYLLANLCLVSILYILNLIFFTLEKVYELITYTHELCVLISGLHRFPIALMTLAIMTLSVDRSRIARNPLEVPSKSNILSQILSVWLVAFFVTLPRAFSSTYDPSRDEYFKCGKIPFLHSRVCQGVYATINFLLVWMLPAIFLVLELRKTRIQMRYLATCEMGRGKSFERRLRLLRNACIFTGIFVLCWLPMGIIQFPLDVVSPDTVGWKPLIYTRDVFVVAMLFQTCVNPLLLQILSFDFQELITSCFL